jgi:peptide-methionine (S)-S-oxide reductase
MIVWFGRQFAWAIGLLALLLACQAELAAQDETSSETKEPKTMQAMFGGGCFWCVEAIFDQLKGVHSVDSGYAGGTTTNPTYQDVCSGGTGHAEVIRIEYDPAVVSYEKLLEVFFKTHDPTTLNRQGPDSGTQYRSSIFYFDDEQKSTAERIKNALDESGAYQSPIVTEIVAASKFFPAEDYHQDYFLKNPDAGYCQFAIRPKLDKFKKVFSESLKPDAK